MPHARVNLPRQWKWIFPILGAFLLFYLGKWAMSKSASQSRSIDAILTGALTFPLAPENISSIPLYQVHLNLWDTLLSAHGEPALARLTDTEQGGRTYLFDIEPDSHFSNGRRITSEDVIFSFARLMHKQPGGHFNAKTVIDHLEKISDERFSIHLKEPTPSFLFLLSIPEMGIVPKEATDSDGKVSKLNVTSGAYVVSGVPTSGQIILLKNPYFKRSDARAPERVAVSFRKETDGLVAAMEKEHADFLELYGSSGAQAFERLKSNDSLSYRLTRPSYSNFLSVNSTRLPEAERRSLSRLVFKQREKYIKIQRDLEKFSYEILPPGTFGSSGAAVPPDASADLNRLPQRLRVAVYDKKAPITLAIIKLFNDAGIQTELQELSEIKGRPDYDISLLGQGMNADYPEIEFNLSMLSPWAFISASSQDQEQISQALHSPERQRRGALLQRVARKLVEDGRVIPLIVRSYAHVYRKDRVSIDQVTDYDGDTPFWRMQLN